MSGKDEIGDEGSKQFAKGNWNLLSKLDLNSSFSIPSKLLCWSLRNSSYRTQILA
jgi:hypothetical protein